MVILENIDIDIDIDMDFLENINIDINIDRGILQNINNDKISYRLEFGISNRATPAPNGQSPNWLRDFCKGAFLRKSL